MKRSTSKTQPILPICDAARAVPNVAYWHETDMPKQSSHVRR